MNCLVNILEGSFVLRVVDVNIAAFIDVVEIQVLPVYLVTPVLGAIVDDHHEVVRVVLVEDGVEVELNPEVGVVVIAWDDEAHWQLLVFIEVPDLVDALVLEGLFLLLFGFPAFVDFQVEGGQIGTLDGISSSGEQADPALMKPLSQFTLGASVEDLVDCLSFFVGLEVLEQADSPLRDWLHAPSLGDLGSCLWDCLRLCWRWLCWISWLRGRL